jgi:hypothetical protein
VLCRRRGPCSCSCLKLCGSNRGEHPVAFEIDRDFLRVGAISGGSRVRCKWGPLPVSFSSTRV